MLTTIKEHLISQHSRISKLINKITKFRNSNVFPGQKMSSKKYQTQD